MIFNTEKFIINKYLINQSLLLLNVEEVESGPFSSQFGFFAFEHYFMRS